MNNLHLGEVRVLGAATASLDEANSAKDDGEIKAAKVEPALPLRGSIDSCAGGFVTGWAYNPNTVNRPVEVAIYDGQEMVGEGVADAYRSDLFEARIGDGRCSFSIHLLKSLYDGHLHELVLVDRATSLPIKGASLAVQVDRAWNVHIDGFDGVALCGAFSPEIDPPDSVNYRIVVDGQLADTGTAWRDGLSNRYPFHCALDRRYFDGMAHVISVVVADQSSGEGNYIDILRPQLTPWHYLAGAPGVVEQLANGGLPAMVTRRLSSFKARIEAAVARGEAIDLQNVLTALSVLNEGYEHRRKFPHLSLPKAAEPEVSIIIPVHNKFELTYHCIASLILSENRCSYEVIVVDDCSTDQTTELADIVDNVRIIVNTENLGFLRNCNKAALAAKGQYVVLLNNDTEVCNRWLDEMLDVFRRYDRVGAVGSKLIYPDGKLQEAGGIVWDNGQPWNLGRNGNPHDPQWSYTRQVDYISGAALMLPKTVWDEVGGLSDEFAPAYYEDTDLAFKVREAGYRTVYCPHSEVIHFEGMSHGRDTSSGFKKYQDINAPKFLAKWAHAYNYNGQVGRDLWRNKDRGVRFRALVIDYATPQPDKDAGSYAAVQEMRLLQAHGFKLTFVPENLAHFGKYTADLQKMGIECIHAPFYLSVQDFFKQRGHEFDLVFITRYNVAERHLEHVRQFTKAKVLFNNADLHFLRELRTELAKGNKELSGPLATRERELGVIRQVDAVLSYNEAEHAVIASHTLQDENIFKCPWVLDIKGHQTPFKQREGIAFLGSYRHPPNVEAVEFFVEKVMPLLRAKGQKIRFHIYGSNPPAEFKRFESDDVILEGYVESLDAVFETCRLFVAPVLSGAGIKGKVLEAMAYGVPSVLSPIAAEATGLSNGISTLIAETPEEWADAIAKLYDDPKQWAALSGNALTLASSNYSFETGWKLMGKALAHLGFYGGKMDTFMVPKQT